MVNVFDWINDKEGSIKKIIIRYKINNTEVK